MLRLLRRLVLFLADGLEAVVHDEYDIRARKEADDKQRKWLSFLGSAAR